MGGPKIAFAPPEPIFQAVANITKQDLIQEIAHSTGFVRGDIKTVIEQFLEIIGEKLIEGRSIEIRGFGTFACKERKARPARNPRTGDSVQLADRVVPTFKFSSEIKSRINQEDFLALIRAAELEAKAQDSGS